MLRKVAQSIIRSQRPIAKELFLCLLSAILLILSFPPFNLEFLAWFGFVPVFFALNNKSGRQAFLLFFVTGAIFWAGIIYWLIHVTLAGTIALVLYLALYFAVFGLVIRPSTKKSTLYSLIFIPSVWVLLEYIRGLLFTGFPWALLGYSQYLNLPVIQIADITGAWGVSFLVMMVNVAVVEMVWSQAKGVSSKLKKVSILLVLSLFLVLSYGYFRLSHSPVIDTRNSVRISVVQGNIPQELKWSPDAKAGILDVYAKFTEQAGKEKPDLIVWPEASSPGIFGEDDLIPGEIFALGRKTGVPLLIGVVAVENERYFNSALLLGPSGEISGRYNKLHLVPFGEYIPLKKALPFLETVVPIGDITPGRDYTIFTLPDVSCPLPLKFSVLICFEDLFPQISREFIKRGAGLLVNITNDAWYKRTSASSQHLQASVFRAVENRVFLVRCANTGISGFIGPGGKIISKVSDKSGGDIFVGGINTREVAVLNKPLTIYTRYGDFFPAICLLFLLYGIIQTFKNRR
ncbi:MAG: apolipoprotein N-acyltransferase [Candidatus Omnitrophota bacterium]